MSVGYEFYDSDYTSTTSDHFPVSARFMVSEFRLDSLTVSNVTCAGQADGVVTALVSGGVTPYTYLWSDGQTTASASGLSGGDYTVTVMDAVGDLLEGEATVLEPQPLVVEYTADTAVYIGYAPLAKTTIGVTGLEGGTAPYDYEWSTGENTQTLEVAPEQTTSYTITVTDSNGCSSEKVILVEVVNVSCGSGRWAKVAMCFYGKSLCVPQWAVPFYLYFGSTLGDCGSRDGNAVSLKIYPNPFVDYIIADVTLPENSNVSFLVYDRFGQLVKTERHDIAAGSTALNIQLSNGDMGTGIYFLRTYINGSFYSAEKLLKK